MTYGLPSLIISWTVLGIFTAILLVPSFVKSSWESFVTNSVTSIISCLDVLFLRNVSKLRVEVTRVCTACITTPYVLGTFILLTWCCFCNITYSNILACKTNQNFESDLKRNCKHFNQPRFRQIQWTLKVKTGDAWPAYFELFMVGFFVLPVMNVPCSDVPDLEQAIIMLKFI